MSGTEAAFLVGLISSIISSIEATRTVYDAAKDIKGQPEAFRQVAARLPLVNEILQSIKDKSQTFDEPTREALKPILNSCKGKAEDLKNVFQQVIRKDDRWYNRYRKAVGTLGKGNKVERLMEGILKDIQVLTCERLMGAATDAQIQELEEAINEMNEMPPSLPDEAGSVIQTHSGSGDNIGHTGPGTMNLHKGSGDLFHNVISGGATFGSNAENLSFYNYIATSVSGGGKSLDLEKSFLEEKRACLQSLSFRNIDARQLDISGAHEGTCDWFFQTSEFQQWRDRIDLLSHNGVLWVQGNPGTGKSTLMKHTLSRCKQNFKDHIVGAYFFNARGDSLEKTPLGMLRSLSNQLLYQEAALYERFAPKFREKMQKYKRGEWEWRQLELEEFLVSGIQCCQSKPLLLLIDALDECNKSDMQHVVGFLERLSAGAICNKVVLKICFSSRHFPSISIEKSLKLVVESRIEHNEDISKYIHDKLIVEDKDIEKGILKKASGIFMWVVLVVTMLNQAHQEGKIESMRQKLSTVPKGLEEMFKTLLKKHNPDIRETIVMLQFVLFAERPLTPEELYFAMIAGTNPKNLSSWNRSKMTADVIRRRITTSSRGLIEIRKSEEDTVQFIHESVTDFLFRNQRLKTLDHTLELDPIGTSHECLMTHCMSYLMMSELSLAKERSDIDKLSFKYPFLEYASTFVLFHAEKAREGLVKNNFVHCLLQQNEIFEQLRYFHNIFEKYTWSACRKGVTPLYMLSYHGHKELVEALLSEEQVDINIQGGLFGTALQAASLGGEVEVMRILLDRGADINARGGLFGSALQVASIKGEKEAVQILLEKGADTNIQGGPFSNALLAALFRDRDEVVRLLLEKGADVNAQGGPFGNALQVASSGGKDEIVQLLLEKGADVNAQGGFFGNALQLASSGGEDEIVRLLLEKGADVNAQGGPFGNALQAALFKGEGEVVRLLLEKGADVNAQGGPFGNALQAALVKGEGEVVRLLLETGADVNAQGGPFGNALQAALVKGEDEVVRLLLETGANSNALDGRLGNTIEAASVGARSEVLRLLLKNGVNINASETNSAQSEDEIVEVLLEKGTDIVIGIGLHGNLLQAALVGGGDTRIVQMLLENGADPNAQGITYGNALQAALSENADKEIIQMLLEKGADVNAQDITCINALGIAVLIEADKEIIRMLLEKGADVNAQAWMFGSALQAAILTEVDEEVINILLENEAEQDPTNSTIHHSLSTYCKTYSFAIAIAVLAVAFLFVKAKIWVD